MSKQFDKKEATELLRRINEGATRSDSNLGEVLRLCMRLGSILGNESLTVWARAEANGYDNADILPDYRIIHTPSKGTFFGAFGSGVKNMLIPTAIIEKDHRNILFNYRVTEPIAEVQRFSSGDEPMRAPWSADTIYYYQQKEFFEDRDDMRLAEAWRVIAPQSMAGIIEIVRTRILDFALKIEGELGVTTTSMATNEPDPKVIQQLFQTTINGNGPIAFANSGQVEQQVINVYAGDLDSLKMYLKSLGIQNTEIEELESALNKDADEEEQPGKATQGWIGRMMIKLGRGAASVGGNAIGSLVAEAIMKYLGQG